MKKLLLLLIFFPFISYAQYDMNYQTFTKYISQEMAESEFKSINEFFKGNVNGMVCFYEYGDFSGDELDEFVVLTSEGGKDINIYIFQGMPDETFRFVNKVNFKYWKTRYEVSVLIKRGVLYVTNTDENYTGWFWNVFNIRNGELNFVKKDLYY